MTRQRAAQIAEWAAIAAIFAAFLVVTLVCLSGPFK